MKLDKVIRLEKSFAEQVHNIYANAARFHWDSDFVNDAVRKMREQDDYKQLPRYAQSFVSGVLHHCRMLHDKLMVFSYVVKGKRLTIDSDEYRKVSPEYVHKHCSDTGCFVYKDEPSKLWTKPAE